MYGCTGEDTGAWRPSQVVHVRLPTAGRCSRFRQLNGRRSTSASSDRTSQDGRIQLSGASCMRRLRLLLIPVFLFSVMATPSLASAQTCAGMAATIIGGPFADVLNGGPGPDVIDGNGGDDIINGNGGDDVICGGLGDDVI